MIEKLSTHILCTYYVRITYIHICTVLLTYLTYVASLSRKRYGTIIGSTYIPVHASQNHSDAFTSFWRMHNGLETTLSTTHGLLWINHFSLHANPGRFDITYVPTCVPRVITYHSTILSHTVKPSNIFIIVFLTCFDRVYVLALHGFVKIPQRHTLYPFLHPHHPSC